MLFRKDINGLRAIAVIAVVLFHFNASWMPGGFAGVDVFFVISGFLMTGIIFGGFERKNFSILNFYIARANRIIPALALLCLVLMVFGWFCLIPRDYAVVGNHIHSSIQFFSNITYWRESGYFDASSHEKWLLHTWSLSVEWQFYIIYPFILVILKKFVTTNTLKPIVLIGTILGFIFCVIVTYKFPSPAYFALPTRAWEMMLGGVAYLYPLRVKNNKALELIGFIMIIGSYLFISKATIWPGYLALIPVMGTFFIIQANRENSLLTSNIVFQKLGIWSYSIYLWHWPLVVAIYFYGLSGNYIYLGIFLSLLLGFLSYHYIEKIKFTRDFPTRLSYLKCKPIYMVLCVGLLGNYVYEVKGKNFLAYSFPENAKIVSLLQDEIVMPKRSNGYCFYSNDIPGFKVDKNIGTNCLLGDDTKPVKTLLFGDSFAGTYEPFFHSLFNKHGKAINSVVTNWCTPSLNGNYTGVKASTAYSQCLLNREYLDSAIQNKKYENIIFAASWSSVSSRGYLNDAKEVIKKANEQGIKVIIMPTPLSYSKDPMSEFYGQVYRGKPTDLSRYIAVYEKNNKVNDDLLSFSLAYKNTYFIQRDCLFNQSGLFDYQGVNVLYNSDSSHLSLLGALSAEKNFASSACYNEVINRLSL